MCPAVLVELRDGTIHEGDQQLGQSLHLALGHLQEKSEEKSSHEANPGHDLLLASSDGHTPGRVIPPSTRSRRAGNEMAANIELEVRLLLADHVHPLPDDIDGTALVTPSAVARLRVQTTDAAVNVHARCRVMNRETEVEIGVMVEDRGGDRLLLLMSTRVADVLTLSELNRNETTHD